MYQYNDYELLYLINENDDLALDIMFQKYIPLIKTRIRGFKIKYWNYEDFFQEGLIMLHRAIQTFNPDSRKTFNKYFDLILQRKFMQILKKESHHFYNVDLVGIGEALMETSTISQPKQDFQEIIEKCRFSKFESQVLKCIIRGEKIREIAKALEVSVKQVYDANDRIRRKMKAHNN
ncbi:MAG: LuxR C-terminal-related transcriptional regulator [Bacilli bacterium]